MSGRGFGDEVDLSGLHHIHGRKGGACLKPTTPLVGEQKEENSMFDWDKVRKKQIVAKRGTENDRDVLDVLAPIWRKPVKPSPSKAELRAQAAEAYLRWATSTATVSSSVTGDVVSTMSSTSVHL
jgi:hypothetical protein